MSSPEAETGRKRVSLPPQSHKYFKWDRGKLPGVYLSKRDSPVVIVDKVRFAHENGFPVYIVGDEFRRVSDCHDILSFLSNIGYVYIFVDAVNKNKTSHNWLSFKIMDYVRDTNMARHGQKSNRTKEYYLALESQGHKVAGKPYRMPIDYDFHPVWMSVSTTVTKID